MKPVNWLDVEIWEPCISWQDCKCCTSMLFIWDLGKEAGLVPTCPACAEPTTIVSVVYTTN